eukprot:6972339-Alexandrium_andersonii.AAC.1
MTQHSTIVAGHLGPSEALAPSNPMVNSGSGANFQAGRGRSLSLAIGPNGPPEVLALPPVDFVPRPRC